jgi:hypothetical protein
MQCLFINFFLLHKRIIFQLPFFILHHRYKNGWHALGKVVSVEGPAALYKGAGANFIRLGPHMILVFVTLEQLKQRFAS